MRALSIMRRALSGLIVLMSLPILVGASDRVYGQLTGDQQLMLLWMMVIAAVFVTDSWMNKWLHLSPIRGFFRALKWSVKLGVKLVVACFWFALEGEKVKSGREAFKPGPFDGVKAAVTRDKGLRLETDNIEARTRMGRPKPEVDTDVHFSIAGPTGVGKSETMKMVLDDLDALDHAAVCHALSSPGKGEGNELVEYARDRGYDVHVASSSGSTCRWDPLLDYDEGWDSAQTVASALVAAGEDMEVGWTEPARQMLVLAVAITGAEYGDFSRLPDVLARDVETIIDQAGDLPNSSMAVRPVMEMSESDRSRAFGAVFRPLSQMLECDIFDSSLDRVSLLDYYENPNGVLVADNIRKEKYAAPFWTFFCDSAIHLSFELPTYQYFAFDELNKIPRLQTLDDLVSAGRSPNAIGVFAFQDLAQMRDVYGTDWAESFWSNCPNTIMFRAGNHKAAEQALDEIGVYEVQQSSQTKSRELGQGPTVTAKTADVSPITTGRLTQLKPGEALIDTPYGWWFGKIKER